MVGIIGKKIGMTSVFNEEGHKVPCTVIEAGPCKITQKRTEEKDGYTALQLAYGEKKQKNTSKALLGHFGKTKSTPAKQLIEFRNFEGDYKEGDEIKLDILKEEGTVDVQGISIGKGFQGGVKRYGFSGVGGQTHGQKDQARRGGSIGAASDPSRVFKGKRMPGRTGNKKVKLTNLKIVRLLPEKNLLFVKGAVPGKKGSYLTIEQ